MGIRRYKPTTPGRRDASVVDFTGITWLKPGKSLLRPLHKTGGRNNTGHIATRYRGGDYKRQYRTIGFRRWDEDGAPMKIAHIEYDPNRTARIALLHYVDGEKRYIVALENLYQSNFVENGPNAGIKPGNNLPLRSIPVGITAYCMELRPLGSTKIGRSAGTSVQLIVREGKYMQLHMPPGEIHNVDSRCRASVGEVGDTKQFNINWGKADRKRWKGVRPTARGVVMNPVDHPHGGGEGRTSGGRHPVSPQGKPEGRTQRPEKASNKLTVRRCKTGNKR